MHMEVWPETAQELFSKVPSMVIHAVLESGVADFLGEVFGEIASATCIDALKVPDILPGASPVEKLLETCLQCKPLSPSQRTFG